MTSDKRQTNAPTQARQPHKQIFKSAGRRSLPKFQKQFKQQRQQRRLEWFSVECRKTKTKVITLANHKEHTQYSEPIKTRRKLQVADAKRGKTRASNVTIGFASDWMKNWRGFFKSIV